MRSFVPNEPMHRKQTDPREDGIYPIHHQQHEHSLPASHRRASPFHSSRIEFGAVQASVRLIHLEARDL